MEERGRRMFDERRDMVNAVDREGKSGVRKGNESSSSRGEKN